MKLNFGKFTFIAILLSLCYACLATDAIDPNQIKNVEKTLTTQKQTNDLLAKAIGEKQASEARIRAELGKEYYKDCVDNLKWALGIIVGLVIVFVGYAMFKSSREYREALADVKDALKDSKEASKEAKTASDKAREYEEKASEKLFKIDEQVTGKLKEIEERGKELISDLIKVAEKQRETSRKEAEKELKAAELWNKGLRAARDEDFQLAANSFGQMVEEFHVENESMYNNWGAALAKLAEQKEGSEAEELFKQALQKFEKAVQIKPDKHEAYNNWGSALTDLAKRKEGTEAEELFKQALQKFEKAVQIKPDMHEAYNNWGSALTDLAKRKEGQDKIQLLKEAKEECLKAESIKQGTAAYNLACVYARLDDEKECELWLKVGEKAGTLPTRSHAMSDSDLASMRDKEWFKQIRWADDKK